MLQIGIMLITCVLRTASPEADCDSGWDAKIIMVQCGVARCNQCIPVQFGKSMCGSFSGVCLTCNIKSNAMRWPWPWPPACTNGDFDIGLAVLAS